MTSGLQHSQLGSSWHVLDEDANPSDASTSDTGDEKDLTPSTSSAAPSMRYATRSQSPQKQRVQHTSNPRRRAARNERTTSRSTRESIADHGPELIMPKLTTPKRPSSKMNARTENSIRTPPSQRLRKGSKKTTRDEDASRANAASAYRNFGAAIWKSLVSPPLAFMTGLLSDTLFFLRPFLGMAFAIFIFVVLVWMTATWTYNRIWETKGLVGIASSAIAPIASLPCSLPILSFAPWCPAERPKDSHASFDHLVQLQDSFGKVLDIAQEGAALPMQITMAEVPLLELRDLIKFQSQLPSKPDLILQFENFVKLARMTSADLSTFNSHVGGAVDKIISMNRHTLRVLEVVREQPTAGLVSYLSSLLPGSSMGKLTSDDVITQYLRHAETVEAQTDALILEGEALQLSLEHMDVQLDDIRETANHDAASLASSKEELFRQLWTYLGFNAKERQKLDRNIAITDRLRSTRADAARVVKLTLHELRRLKSGIVDLRARVVGPRWRGSMDEMEIEEHIRYVQDGLARLYQKRLDSNSRQQAGINGVLKYAKSVFKDAGQNSLPNGPAEISS